MREMHEAPTDGSRVLLKVRVVLSRGRAGTKWADARFIGGQWREWTGCHKTTPPRGLSPIGWMPHPEAEEAA